MGQIVLWSKRERGPGMRRPHPTAAQPHTVPKGPFGSPASCSGGLSHQPTAGSPAAGWLDMGQ